jgi:hypothetical protein
MAAIYHKHGDRMRFKPALSDLNKGLVRSVDIKDSMVALAYEAPFVLLGFCTRHHRGLVDQAADELDVQNVRFHKP